MTSDKRQRARAAHFARLIAVFQAVAIAYLVLHAAVAWVAYRESGAVAALATIAMLGIGDLYWLAQLARSHGVTGETLVAAAAALLCLASWFGRPAFNRWAARTERDLLRDAVVQLDARAPHRTSTATGDDDQT